MLEGVHTLEVDAPGWYFEQVKLDVSYKGNYLKVRPSLNGESGGSKVSLHHAPRACAPLCQRHIFQTGRVVCSALAYQLEGLG